VADIGRRVRAFWAVALLGIASVGGPAPARAATVPPPFQPLRVTGSTGAVSVGLWGRTYDFRRGPLPETIRSRGRQMFLAPPRFQAAVSQVARSVVWQDTRVISSAPDVVRLKTIGQMPGIQVVALTRIEYDGMIAVQLTFTAQQALTFDRLTYELQLGEQVANHYARHLPYDPAQENVDKAQLPYSAGGVPARLALDFVPTLALGNQSVGIEWWSETDAHWTPAVDVPPFEVTRGSGMTKLRVTPIAFPLVLAAGQAWRDSFSLFVFPTRPPPPRWRSVRMMPYSRVWSLDPNVGSRFVFMASQEAFHAQYDGLPASVNDAFQRSVRADLARRGVGYIPYSMLFVAPLLHPRTMSSFDAWAAHKWWKLLPGWTNPVIERTHPSAAVGDPYTYPPCAARKDYFDWMLEQNLATLRAERPDGFYFDQGAITRLCLRNPILAGKVGRQSWEYGNVRDFYKRLYEAVKTESPEALIVIHTHGTPKALGAFVDFNISGESLNGVFGAPYTATQYFANPDIYRPDYFALPPSYLEAQLLPRVGGVSSLIPQVKWAIDPDRPSRARAFQRRLHAITLVNDVHAPIWASDVDASLEIYRALDRFGDLGNVSVYEWWKNAQRIQRPAGLKVTAYVRAGRALLVLTNPGTTRVRGRVTLDLDGLKLSSARRYLDLERSTTSQPLVNDGLDVDVPPQDLRLMLVE
jgi:hypothetical protein